MRSFFLVILLCGLGIVHSLSTTGNRLLVVLEELAEKDRYSKFWGDLEGKLRMVIWDKANRNRVERGYKLTFESPKNDKLSLFHLGERSYDHLIILPPKSKGTFIYIPLWRDMF